MDHKSKPFPENLLWYQISRANCTHKPQGQADTHLASLYEALQMITPVLCTENPPVLLHRLESHH